MTVRGMVVMRRGESTVVPKAALALRAGERVERNRDVRGEG